MKKIFLLVLAGFFIIAASAQKQVLTNDPAVPIPPLTFDVNGNLVITASAESSQRDFDFLVGKWKMYNRRLNKRLENHTEWTEFISWDENHHLLNGNANMDTYSTTEMPGMEGKPFEGVTIRLFNPKTRLWSLYWVASNVGVLDPPVVGSFEKGIGHFFTKDTFNGKPIIMMFRWDVRDKNRPVWGQAFSPDNGKTWEWNMFNVSERTK
jgi:hypothetical protein